MTTSAIGIDRFNQLPESEARAALHSCLAVPRWIDVLLAGRPYDDAASLHERARAQAVTLTGDEVELALARHPRIGERAAEGHDAAFSRREQAAMGGAEPDTAQAIADGNILYENRFQRVFLIRAAGRSPAEIMSELTRRLRNDQATETAEVVEQLTQIALGRLDLAIGH